MKIRVVIEYDPVARSYAAWCPELPGCTSCGATEEEAYQNMHEAVELYLDPSPGEVAPGAKIVELTL